MNQDALNEIEHIYVPNIGLRLASIIDAEIERSHKHDEVFASLHEAYAVILEELDEVWDITRLKRKNRDSDKLREEFIQIAAMAIKAIHSMDNFVGGNI
jgi:hypothetical protein